MTCLCRTRNAGLTIAIVANTKRNVLAARFGQDNRKTDPEADHPGEMCRLGLFEFVDAIAKPCRPTLEGIRHL